MTIFEIRDPTRPGEDPLAVEIDYPTARAAMAALHDQFWGQLDANGEGSSHVRMRLAVTQIEPGCPPATRAISTVSG